MSHTDRSESTSAVERALLQAGVELIHGKGYDAVSVQEIVTAAGVTKGAFYHYFPSKAALLRLVHDRYIDYQLGRIREIVATVVDPRDQLRATMRCFMEAVGAHRAEIVIFEQEWRYLEGEGYEDIRRKRQEIADLVRGQVERGIAEGVISSAQPPLMVTYAITGMCTWAYRWFQADGKLTADEIADVWADMVLGGIESTPDV